MKVMRIYSDTQGIARVEWRQVPLDADGTGRATSRRWPAGEIFFRETASEHDRGKHRAPQRQLISVVSGGGEIELDDGSIHRFGVRDHIFTEDTERLGHVTHNQERARDFVHITVPDEFVLTHWPVAR